MRIFKAFISTLVYVTTIKCTQARTCAISDRSSAPSSAPTPLPDFTGLDSTSITMPYMPDDPTIWAATGSPVSQMTLGLEYDYDYPNEDNGSLFHWVHWTGTGALYNAQLSIVPSDIKHIDIDMVMLNVSSSGSPTELTPDFYALVYTVGTTNSWYEDKWILSLPSFTTSDLSATDVTSHRIEISDWEHPDTLIWKDDSAPYGNNIEEDMASFEGAEETVLGIAIGSNTAGYIHAILNAVSIELISGQTIDISYTSS